MSETNSNAPISNNQESRPLTTFMGKPCVTMTRVEADAAQVKFDQMYAQGVADGSVDAHNFGSMMDIFWARTHFGAKYVQIESVADPVESAQSEPVPKA